MRELQASAEPGARLAIDYFTYRLAREAASLACALGGLDALVFTAGIGENSASIRAAVCERLAWMGLTLDGPVNDATVQGSLRITTDDSRIEAWRMPTDEERVIARHTLDLLGTPLE